MRMRNIALIALVFGILATLGCSKKTEEHANETEMAPAPSSQEMAPAPMPMQDMDSAESQSSDADTNTMDAPESGQEESKDAPESSGME